MRCNDSRSFSVGNVHICSKSLEVDGSADVVVGLDEEVGVFLGKLAGVGGHL